MSSRAARSLTRLTAAPSTSSAGRPAARRSAVVAPYRSDFLSGGAEEVRGLIHDAVAIDTTLDGGVQNVDGGTASGTTINNGGVQNVTAVVSGLMPRREQRSI